MRRSIGISGRALVATLLLLLPARAAEVEPTAQVQVAPLEKGSLPLVVDAYGSIEPSAAARHTVTAPLAAVVGEVSARQGAEVAAGTPLLTLVPSPKESASYAQAQSALDVARQLVRRTGELVAQQLATKQQLAEAQKSETDARAALQALAAQGAAGPTILRAPFRAIVTGVMTSAGAIVAEGAALIELARPEGLVLRVGVVPASAGAIRPGDPATITVIGGRSDMAGTVVMRGSAISAGNGLVPVEISLSGASVFPGETAAVAITTGEAEGYVVPHEAVLVDEHGASYVMQAVDLTARKVLIRVLAARDDKDVIAGPLDPAAPLVLAGSYQLRDGMKVRIAAPEAKAGAR
jgi:membrane fusion protein (multidrug efflux system)